ncbi:MAG: RNA pyrophosphohydrolase [Hellea sp.]|nr:RNA pyrophosphohydrolase [Hellea sp.]
MNSILNDRPYRPCVGMVIFNSEGLVWLGRRARESGPYVWQFPQGGVDPGETPVFAAIRETEEETGISVQNLAPLGRIEGELYYDYPADIEQNVRTRRWRGQRQSWFATRFTGVDSDVDLNAQTPPEFSQWRWGTLAETLNLVVPFKRRVYSHLIQEFSMFAHPA